MLCVFWEDVGGGLVGFFDVMLDVGDGVCCE